MNDYRAAEFRIVEDGDIYHIHRCISRSSDATFPVGVDMREYPWVGIVIYEENPHKDIPPKRDWLCRIYSIFGTRDGKKYVEYRVAAKSRECALDLWLELVPSELTHPEESNE